MPLIPFVDRPVNRNHYRRWTPALLLGLALALYGLRALILWLLGPAIRREPPVTYGSLGLVYGLLALVVWQVARRDPLFRREVGLTWAGGRLALALAAGLGTGA